MLVGEVVVVQCATVMLWIHFLQAIERKTNILLSYTFTYTFTGGKSVLEIEQETFEEIL